MSGAAPALALLTLCLPPLPPLARLLAPRNPTPVLISSLLVISQLARSTHAHHGAVAASGLVQAMPALLRHGDATVRARSCNLLGNLCRHRWAWPLRRGCCCCLMDSAGIHPT